jgi:predicted metal-dependent peptidase
MDEARKIMKRLCQAVYREQRFFYGILVPQHKVPSGDVEVFGVDGDTIYYNPDYLVEMDANKQTDVLKFQMLEAIQSVAWMHPDRAARIPDIQQGIYDKACGIVNVCSIYEIPHKDNTVKDAAGNKMQVAVDDPNYKPKYALPEGYHYHGEYSGMPVTTVYKKLLDLAKQQPPNQQPQQPPPQQGQQPPPQGGSGSGSGGGQPDPNAPPQQGQQPQGGQGQGGQGQQGQGKDDGQAQGPDTGKHGTQIMKREGMTEEEVAQHEQKMKSRLQQAKMACGEGDMSADMLRRIERSVNPPPSYREIITRFLHDKVRHGNDWSRRSRRYLDYPVYMPRKGTKGICNNLLLIKDTSGSVQNGEIKDSLACTFQVTQEIEQTGNTPDLTIMYVDHAVCNVEKLAYGQEPEVRGGGGTAFSPAWDYIAKNNLNYTGIVYFTDGECSGYDKIIGKHGKDVIYNTSILWMLTRNGASAQKFERFIEEHQFGECVYVNE